MIELVTKSKLLIKKQTANEAKQMCQILLDYYRSSHPKMFREKVPRFTIKHLCQSLFFSKVAGFSKHQFCWTPKNACFRHHMHNLDEHFNELKQLSIHLKFEQYVEIIALQTKAGFSTWMKFFQQLWLLKCCKKQNFSYIRFFISNGIYLY